MLLMKNAQIGQCIKPDSGERARSNTASKLPNMDDLGFGRTAPQNTTRRPNYADKAGVRSI